MQAPQSNKKALTIAISVALGALIVGGFGYGSFLSTAKDLDNAVSKEDWLQARSEAAHAALPVVPGIGPASGAASKYLVAYLAERAGDIGGASEILVATDKSVPGNQLADVAESLINASQAYEFRYKMPSLADACARCSVQLARRRASEAGAAGQVILARTLINMAKLCRWQGKYQLAVQAGDESIATARRAYTPSTIALTADGKISHDPESGRVLYDCLSFQSELLDVLKRPDEAAILRSHREGIVR